MVGEKNCQCDVIKDFNKSNLRLPIPQVAELGVFFPIRPIYNLRKGLEFMMDYEIREI